MIGEAWLTLLSTRSSTTAVVFEYGEYPHCSAIMNETKIDAVTQYSCSQLYSYWYPTTAVVHVLYVYDIDRAKLSAPAMPRSVASDT